MASQHGHKPDGAVTIFVLGLLGLLVCVICGIIAWVQGNTYMEECRRAGVEPEGLAVAGRIMGIISCVLLIVVLIIYAIIFVGLAAGAA